MNPDDKTSQFDPSPMSAQAEIAPLYDSWEIDDQLWRIAQALEIKVSGTIFDRGSINTCKKKVPDTFIDTFISAALSLGTAALVCGGVLLGWSLWSGRGELWNIGLPIAAAGLTSLLIGMLLQASRSWRDNRHTISSLFEEGNKFRDLKTTAELLDAVDGPSSTTFNVHPVGTSNPHFPMCDLEGQLDLQAMEIRDQEDDLQ
jgi:hypothetical protein